MTIINWFRPDSKEIYKWVKHFQWYKAIWNLDSIETWKALWRHVNMNRFRSLRPDCCAVPQALRKQETIFDVLRTISKRFSYIANKPKQNFSKQKQQTVYVDRFLNRRSQEKGTTLLWNWVKCDIPFDRA